MNVQQLQAVQSRLQEVLRFANAQGENGRKTAMKIQMVLDECDTCIRQHNSRNTYLLELMLRDPVVRCIMRADLCRPTWNGRSVVFATDADVHQRAVDASEKIGIDIMI